MNRCPHCSAPVATEHVFCTQCGGALVSPVSEMRIERAFPPLESTVDLGLEWVRGPAVAERDPIALREGEQSVGTEGAICLQSDRHASAHHARITSRGGTLLIADTGSRNGTWIRLRGAEFPLGDGEVFRVGEQWLRFELHVALDEPGSGVEFAGTPLRPWRLKVTQLLEGGGEGLAYSTRRDRMVIGREACDVNFRGDAYVSGRHCELRWREDAIVLRDLGSLNGTFIQLAPGGEVSLEAGDEIVLGEHLARVIARA